LLISNIFVAAKTFYDDWIMTFFNITITALPPLAIGVFEKDISDTLIEKVSHFLYIMGKNKSLTFLI